MLLWPNRCNVPDDFATTFESQWHGSPPSSANCFTFRLRMREPSPGQQDAQVGVNMKNPEGNLPDFPLPKKRCYKLHSSVILPLRGIFATCGCLLCVGCTEICPMVFVLKMQDPELKPPQNLSHQDLSH